MGLADSLPDLHRPAGVLGLHPVEIERDADLPADEGRGQRLQGAADRETLLNVGNRPTRNVAVPMTMMVTRKVYLRPTRSPIRPNTSAPNGRTRNPAA